MLKIMKQKCDKMATKQKNELPLWCPSFMFPGIWATYPEKNAQSIAKHPRVE